MLQVQGQEQIADGEGLFQWLISPVDVETFDEAIEELQPLLVSRPHNRQYFKGLFSKAGKAPCGCKRCAGADMGLFSCRPARATKVGGMSI